MIELYNSKKPNKRQKDKIWDAPHLTEEEIKIFGLRSPEYYDPLRLTTIQHRPINMGLSTIRPHITNDSLDVEGVKPVIGKALPSFEHLKESGRNSLEQKPSDKEISWVNHPIILEEGED